MIFAASFPLGSDKDAADCQVDARWLENRDGTNFEECHCPAAYA